MKRSNFIQNKVGHELVNKDGKNCTSGNLLFGGSLESP